MGKEKSNQNNKKIDEVREKNLPEPSEWATRALIIVTVILLALFIYFLAVLMF